VEMKVVASGLPRLISGESLSEKHRDGQQQRQSNGPQTALARRAAKCRSFGPCAGGIHARVLGRLKSV
jgi:hypothetical protein